MPRPPGSVSRRLSGLSLAAAIALASAPAAADPRVAGFAASVTGTTLRIDAKVCETGAAGAVVGLSLFAGGRPAACGAAGALASGSVSVAAGSCAPVEATFDVSGVAAGSGALWLVADPTCALPDAVRADNTAPALVTLGAAVPTCTQVIGFSQVGEWFSNDPTFEATVDGDRWQGLIQGGAAIDRWADPSFAGWMQPIRSTCARGGAAPDRVLLVISGSFGTDEAAWARAIFEALVTASAKIPSARQFILQPVVGGPNHGDCLFGGRTRIRASWQHAHIDRAISMVVEAVGSPQVVAGFSPEVSTCADYRDQLGHLGTGGRAAAGRAIGVFYKGRTF